MSASTYGELLEARGILDRARAEGRAPTESELARVKAAAARADRAEVSAKANAHFDDLLGSATNVSPYGGEGIGDAFVQSEGYKQIRYSDARPQRWSSGPVQVKSPMEYKGTLLETTAGGPGGGAVPPYYVPGINSKLFEPLGLADVFGQSQAFGSQVRYVTEGTATSGAAGVAEGAAKPESTLVMSEVQEARDGELHPGWQAAQQKRDRVVDRSAANQVVVVENEHERLVDRGEVIDEQRTTVSFNAAPAAGKATRAPSPTSGRTARKAPIT